MMRTWIRTGLLLCLLPCPLCWAVDYDESIDGDLPDDRFVPALFTLDDGSNIFALTGGFSDRDYFTLTVPADRELARIDLLAYTPSFGVSFIGVQPGSMITVPPTVLDPGELLGYTLFGEEHVGTDILSDIGNGIGAIQFTPPLPSGQYAFWAQETGQFEVAFAFDFVVTVVPEPTGYYLFAAPLAVLWSVARRCRIDRF